MVAYGTWDEEKQCVIKKECMACGHEHKHGHKHQHKGEQRE